MEELKTSKAESNKVLLERYPILEPYYATAPNVTPYNYEITVLDYVYAGWRSIFLDACDEIMAHLKKVGVDLKDFHFFGVKAKTGTLQVDTEGYRDDVIDNILWDLEQRSMLYCPNCGAPTKCATRNPMLFLCTQCAQKSQLEFDWLTRNDVPIIKEHDYKTGRTVEKPTKYDDQFRRQWDAIPHDD